MYFSPVSPKVETLCRRRTVIPARASFPSAKPILIQMSKKKKNFLITTETRESIHIRRASPTPRFENVGDLRFGAAIDPTENKSNETANELIILAAAKIAKNEK